MSEPLDPLNDVIECFRVRWMNGEEKFFRWEGIVKISASSITFEDEKGITELIPLYQVMNVERVFVKLKESDEPDPA